MGTGVGGLPIDEAARVTVGAVRAELAGSPSIEHVTFAMRGAAAYEAFEAALAEADEGLAGRAGSGAPGGSVAAGGSGATGPAPTNRAVHA